jgi:hypothetical protein
VLRKLQFFNVAQRLPSGENAQPRVVKLQIATPHPA